MRIARDHGCAPHDVLDWPAIEVDSLICLYIAEAEEAEKARKRAEAEAKAKSRAGHRR